MSDAAVDDIVALLPPLLTIRVHAAPLATPPTKKNSGTSCTAQVITCRDGKAPSALLTDTMPSASTEIAAMVQ